MSLIVTQTERALVAEAARTGGMLLGLIDVSRRIMLARSSRTGLHGHEDWLHAEPQIRPFRGFSIGFDRGNVGVHRASGVNPPSLAHLLEEHLAEEIANVLDLRSFGTVRIYGH